MKNSIVALFALVSIALIFSSSAIAGGNENCTTPGGSAIITDEGGKYHCDGAQYMCEPALQCLQDVAKSDGCFFIESGDTLSVIAKRNGWGYDATVGSWAKEYPNGNPHKIVPGQKFCYDSGHASYGAGLLTRYKMPRSCCHHSHKHSKAVVAKQTYQPLQPAPQYQPQSAPVASAGPCIPTRNDRTGDFMTLSGGCDVFVPDGYDGQ